MDVRLPEDLEALAVGQLHVHEDQVRAVVLEVLRGGLDRVQCPDDVEIGEILLYQPYEYLLSWELVFYYQDIHNGGKVKTKIPFVKKMLQSVSLFLQSVGKYNN